MGKGKVMSQSYQNRYSASLMFLHWLVFILIVATYLIIKVRGYLPEDDAMRATLMSAHKSIGVGLLAIVIGRLFIRWNSSYPPISPPVSKMYHTMVVLGHYALYALLLIMPISGYLMSSAAGREVTFLGWVLPNLVGQDEVLSQNMYDLHVWSSQLIYVLVGLHIVMALWHHFVRKDNTLVRMMPMKKSGDMKASVKSSTPRVSIPSKPLNASVETKSPRVSPSASKLAKPTKVANKAKVAVKPKATTKPKTQSEAKASGAKAATKPKAASTTKANAKPKATAMPTAAKPKAKTTAAAKPKAVAKPKAATAKPRATPAAKPKKAEPGTK